MIVCPDVDIGTVAPQVVWGAFRNSGQVRSEYSCTCYSAPCPLYSSSISRVETLYQVCVASKRIYVHQDIYDDFVEAMIKTAATLKIGPIQNRVQYDKVKEYIEDCRSQGHRILVGGDVPQGRGYFVNPTIIGDPPNDSRIVVEEPFGMSLEQYLHRNLYPGLDISYLLHLHVAFPVCDFSSLIALFLVLLPPFQDLVDTIMSYLIHNTTLYPLAPFYRATLSFSYPSSITSPLPPPTNVIRPHRARSTLADRGRSDRSRE